VSEATQKLSFIILLSAIKKQANEIRIRKDVRYGVVVEFLIDGVMREEMQMPPMIHGALVETFAQMANTPLPGANEEARGHLHIAVGEAGHHYFELEIVGQGALHLRPITEAQMPAV
jgi:hypothetical protein